MIPIEDASAVSRQSNLAKMPAGDIAQRSRMLSVGQLEYALLARFPREDAEPWDRTGLVVGNPAETVKRVAIALDVTRPAIRAAANAGANVLVTHHPVFLDPPEAVSPSFEVATSSGVNVWEAVSSGVALMNFHTALDVSDAAARLLPGMLSLEFNRLCVPAGAGGSKGYGSLCRVKDADAPFKLAHLAARCTSVFGRAPRVWGDFSQELKTVVVANGSAGGVVDSALAAKADCLVCGELKYHSALDASAAGLCIVELGHDVSELPLTALLAQAVIEAGVASEDVSIIEQDGNWAYPDSTRI